MGEEDLVRVHGWVSEVRNLGKVRFIVIRNWNERIQITLKRGMVEDSLFDLTENLTQESVIEVVGKEVKEKIAVGADREVIPERIIVHSLANPQLPLDPNWKVPAQVPTRFDNRPLDLRRPEIQAIFKIESSLLDGMEDWLRRNGFIRVFTPALIGAASESGAEVFKVLYFDKEAYLRQDPQLHRQLTILGGFERIYDLGTNWRAELSRTPRHLSEFRSLAVELAFIENEQDTMRVEEQIIREGIKRVVEERSKELELLNVDLDVPKVPFPELRFPKIYEILEEYGKIIEYGEDYDTESERLLWQYVRENYESDFFFVNRFPFKVKPFYVMKEDDTWARSVDLLYKGLELSSGGQREHRYDVLISQIREKGLDPRSLEWFTKFFAYGAPPHGGFAIGIERLLMKMLELSSVKEASLFPRDPDRILP
ncbi:aspartate--tRNA(Asn) ligase [Candidatus Korarchaeum cryptofilum]|jgi:nondiscriminating aspartyl-tRNA synthetase|uniref:aspartate--tRNA(Asn) ligase n=1 Tax=Candidatus Korarchaeum cryptofilum TaxID=498846 RepID=UPI0006985883|nr:aspartate--tRNA(Asn) ligase [Candidatus Korarchaeum cryptofilum]